MCERKKCVSKITVIYFLITFLGTGAVLYEGNPCTVEDGSAGKCTMISKCPMRIKQIQEGKYNPSTGRCSFDNFEEIVCCPKQTNGVSPGSDGNLSEGSPCKMEDGTGTGDCTALLKCPMRIKQVLEGRRFTTSTGRCSFNGLTEIVCCPRNTKPPTSTNPPGIYQRPAKQACTEYESQITGEDGETINPNIFNGEAAELGEFPYMVALGYILNPTTSSALSYICGGTLITGTHILTAAHCLSNINEYEPKVARLGSVNLKDQASYVQVIRVSSSITHSSYRRSLNYYDIGIVTLERSVRYSQYVVPICLQTIPIPNLDELLKLSLVVTGWGATSFDSTGTSDLQKTPSLQMVEQQECRKDYETFERLPRGVDDSLICVLDRNKTRNSDSCQGDSGGPLLLLSRYTSTVIGIVSFGQSCGSSIPAIYTSVYHYLDWIEQVVWPQKKRYG